jgi:hypothetical protein
MKLGISKNGIQRIARRVVAGSISASDTLWLVTDPISNESTPDDLCWETNLDRLANYFIGSITGRNRSPSPSEVNMVLYTDEDSALADATSRLAEFLGRQ